MPENDSDVGQYQVDAPPTNRSLLTIGMIWWQYLRPCHRLKNVAIDFHWYHSFFLSHLLCYMFNLCVSTLSPGLLRCQTNTIYSSYLISFATIAVDCCIVHLGMSGWLIVALCIWGCLYGWLLYTSSEVVLMVDCCIVHLGLSRCLIVVLHLGCPSFSCSAFTVRTMRYTSDISVPFTHTGDSTSNLSFQSCISPITRHLMISIQQRIAIVAIPCPTHVHCST